MIPGMFLDNVSFIWTLLGQSMVHQPSLWKDEPYDMNMCFSYATATYITLGTCAGNPEPHGASNDLSLFVREHSLSSCYVPCTSLGTHTYMTVFLTILSTYQAEVQWGLFSCPQITQAVNDIKRVKNQLCQVPKPLTGAISHWGQASAGHRYPCCQPSTGPAPVPPAASKHPSVQVNKLLLLTTACGEGKSSGKRLTAILLATSFMKRCTVFFKKP